MKLLCNVFDKIDAGSEQHVREQLNTVLGLWSARHGTAHTIVAVSENSVAFSDVDHNLFVAKWALDSGKAMITDIKKLLNVKEEMESKDFLGEFAEQFVHLVAEDQEDQASKLVGIVLEMRQKALKAEKATTVAEAAKNRKHFVKEQTVARARILEAAKSNAKKKVFKIAKKIRVHESEKENIQESLKELPGVAVALMASLELAKNEPLIEGFITEKSEVTGLPLQIRAKGFKSLISVCEEEEEKEEEKEEKEDKDDDKDDKDDKKDSDKDDKKKDKDEDDKEDEDDDDKKEEKEDDDKDDKKDEDDKKTEEGVIVVNLTAIKEALDPRKDFFYRSSLAWRAFRADPVTEETATLIQNGSTATEILKSSPFLALLDENEVYEAIAPHVEAFDPNDIREIAKAIVAEAVSEGGEKAKEKFITALGDGEISEMIKESKQSLSKNLDALFLEGDDFDFGAADDLGSDDLGDDSDVEGMQDQEGDDEIESDMSSDTGEMEDEGPEIQFSMPADKAREMFKNVLDVIGDEIEDSDEFADLKAKVDNEEEELTGDDVSAILQTIGDYFEATGKSQEDQKEQQAQDEMDGENLDDMKDMGDGQGGEDDTEGAAGEPGLDNQNSTSDELKLGA